MRVYELIDWLETFERDAEVRIAGVIDDDGGVHGEIQVWGEDDYAEMARS